MTRHKQVWDYLVHGLTFRQELSPFLPRGPSCRSFWQTAAPPHLSWGLHADKGSSALVLLLEVQNSAVSAPFRIVNTTCQHSSGHQKENADTSRSHYFSVLKHLNITAEQQGGQHPRPTAGQPPKRVINVWCGLHTQPQFPNSWRHSELSHQRRL